MASWPSGVIAVRGLNWFTLDLAPLCTLSGWVQVFAVLLMLLFSISGALLGCARMAGLMQPDGGIPGGTAVYLTCGLATLLSAWIGSSPVFISMSAAAGIREGAKTGLMSVVLGFYCLVTAFLFSPLASAVPHCAIAPVLVLVGLSMTGEAREVNWWSMQESLPAFLCAVFQPFTYSVANGIYAGVGMSAVLFFTTGSFLSFVPERRRCRCCNRKQQRHHPSSASMHLSVSQATLMSRNRLASFVEGEEEGEGRSTTKDIPSFRQCFRRLSVRVKARKILISVARCLGLDTKVVEAEIDGRFLACRKAEAHCIGGIPGCEAEVVREEIHQTLMHRDPSLGLVTRTSDRFDIPRICMARREVSATRLAGSDGSQ